MANFAGHKCTFRMRILSEGHCNPTSDFDSVKSGASSYSALLVLYRSLTPDFADKLHYHNGALA